MIKIRHKLFGTVRQCPSEACAERIINNGKDVWELANKPVVNEKAATYMKYGADASSKSKEDINPELTELRERYFAQKGKKAHWKKNIETLRKELDG
jgi:hypothetical protein